MKIAENLEFNKQYYAYTQPEGYSVFYILCGSTDDIPDNAIRTIPTKINDGDAWYLCITQINPS